MSSVGLGFIRKPLLINQTASGALGTANVQGTQTCSIYLTGTGTTSSGVITLETADYPEEPGPGNVVGYTGTWSLLTTVNASTLTGGQQTQVILAAGAYSHVRARITTVIGGGGTVSATALAV